MSPTLPRYQWPVHRDGLRRQSFIFLGPYPSLFDTEAVSIYIFLRWKVKKKTCKSHHVGDSSICIEVAFYDLQIHHSFLNFWQWSTLSRTNVPEGIGSSGHPAHLNVAPERSQEQEHWVQDLDDGPLHRCWRTQAFSCLFFVFRYFSGNPFSFQHSLLHKRPIFGFFVSQ